MGMNAVLSEKGQVTIPKKIRDRMGLRTGTLLSFETTGGKMVVTKVSPTDPLDALVGILKTTISTDHYMAEIRGKVR
jgi:AbrB family looped-hinge helix DNA binding protein